MLTKKRYTSPIDTSQVNGVFNERFTWARYKAEYSGPWTEYQWDKYNSIQKTKYIWTKYYAVGSPVFYWNRYMQGGFRFKVIGPNEIWITQNVPSMKKGSKPVLKSLTEYTQTVTDIPNIQQNPQAYVGNWSPVVDTSPLRCVEILSYLGYMLWDVFNVYGHKYAAQDHEACEGPGQWVSEETSTSRSTYPDDGKHGIYWFTYSHEEMVWNKGSIVGSASAYDSRNAYPDDAKHSDGFWYTYNRSELEYFQGTTKYQSVTSAVETAYPTNGKHSDTYWYVKTGHIDHEGYYYKGDYVEEIKSPREDEYPENGRHTDGFWYVKIE